MRLLSCQSFLVALLLFFHNHICGDRDLLQPFYRRDGHHRDSFRASKIQSRSRILHLTSTSDFEVISWANRSATCSSCVKNGVSHQAASISKRRPVSPSLSMRPYRFPESH